MSVLFAKGAGGVAAAVNAVTSAVASAGSVGCGTGALNGKRGFQKGNHCQKQRNQNVLAAQKAHTAARGVAAKHAKKGTLLTPEGKAAISTAAKASRTLHEARAAHRAAKREARNVAARETRATAKTQPAAEPKPVAPAKSEAMKAQVEKSATAASDTLAARAHERIEALKQGAAAGTHDNEAILAGVDKLARGTNKSELFDAAKRAGIEHAETTKVGLVNAIKGHVYDHGQAHAKAEPAKVEPVTKKATEPAPKPAAKPQPAKVAADPAAGLPARLHEHAAKLYKAEATDYEAGKAAIASIKNLPTKDLHAIAHEFLGVPQRSATKAKLLAAFDKRIGEVTASRDRTNDIQGIARVANNRDPRLKSPAEQGEIASRLAAQIAPSKPRAAKDPNALPKAAPKPRAEPKPVGPLPDHLHEHASRLYKAETGNFDDTKAAIASIKHLPVKDLQAIRREITGVAPAADTKGKHLAAIRKRIAEMQSSRDRTDDIQGVKTTPVNRDPRLNQAKPTLKAKVDAEGTHTPSRPSTLNTKAIPEGTAGDRKILAAIKAVVRRPEQHGADISRTPGDDETLVKVAHVRKAVDAKIGPVDPARFDRVAKVARADGKIGLLESGDSRPFSVSDIRGAIYNADNLFHWFVRKHKRPNK